MSMGGSYLSGRVVFHSVDLVSVGGSLFHGRVLFQWEGFIFSQGRDWRLRRCHGDGGPSAW